MANELSTTQAALLQRLKDMGVKQHMIARALGLNQSAVSNMYQGKRLLKNDEAVRLRQEWPAGAVAVREVPVIGMSGAGNWLEAIEHTTDTVPLPGDAEGKFAVRVSGDSMDVILPDGSNAIIDPESTELFVGKIYLLRNADGEVTIKRYRADPARFEPVSYNGEHKPFSLSSGSFSVIGQVTGAHVNLR